MSEKILGNLRRGLLFIISAPTGTGKTTLAGMLLNEFPDLIVASLSYTTREARENEQNGVHYNFISEEEFKEKISQNHFLEYVKLYDYYYGTSREWVEIHLDQGKHVVLVIDTQGALLLRGKVDAIFIFIKPPSFIELEQRLLNRQTESQEAIEKRLAWVAIELEQSVHYDYLIVNDRLETAYEVLKSIFIAEEHKVKYKKYLK